MSAQPPYAGQTVFYQDGLVEVPALVAVVYPWSIGQPIRCDLFILNGTGLAIAIPSDETTHATQTWHAQPIAPNPYGPVTQLPVIPCTAGPVSMTPGVLYTNEGAIVEVELLLPETLWAGFVCAGYVQNANGLLITAQGGATIRIGGSGPGSTAESFSRGSYLELVAINGSEWIGKPSAGLWNVY